MYISPTELPPMLNLLATDANNTTYDRNSLAYMRFVIQESSAQDQAQLVEVLKVMKYPQFLKTVYWRIVKAHVMALQPKCQRCRLKDTRFIHHRNYQIHGMEHDNLGALVGVCGDCHQREHDLLPEVEKEVRETQARFYSESSNQGSMEHISTFLRDMDFLKEQLE